MTGFIGREGELKQLEDLMLAGRAAVAVIRGRRRIGKSRLAEEFGREKRFLDFTGIAPIRGVTAQDQRDHFARQLATHFHLPPFTFTNWSDGFAHLSRLLTGEPTVILLDEISWMGLKDPTFVPKLKDWWDRVLQKRQKTVLILCGSISTWIDKNIINSTAFFGRISLYLTLTELSIPKSREFLLSRGFKGSDLDIFKILCMTSGVPWYLEQILSRETSDENIRRLCFAKEGVLVHEFNRIFHDLFSSRGEIYKKIVELLSLGMKSRADLQKALRYSASGTLSDHLKALETCGFVSKHPEWSLTIGKTSKRALYRLCDNYLRFYLHYIEPNLAKIEQGAFGELPLSSLPGLEPMLGFQLENLLLKNRPLLYKALGIHAQDIVIDNPYFQKSGKQKKGCQIDYLIQTRSNTLFVCEVKMRRRELGLEVIDALQEKIKALDLPKGFGVAPVLLYLGSLSDALLSSSYFYRTINIGEL